MKISKKLTPRQFIRFWQKAQSIEEVAKKAGTKVNSLYGRAAFFRSKGVPLKRLKKKKSLYGDWKSLADYAKRMV